MINMARQNPFNQKKASILAEIQSDERDLSPKGDIDLLCLPIINLINSHEDMVTTSSCSGRVSVFIEGDKEHNGVLKAGGKGEGGRWLYVSHDIGQVQGWLDRIQLDGVKFPESNAEYGFTHFDGTERLILYKYEPFILHVKCRDIHTATKLYNVAMACGYRESGIGSNNLVAVRTNIKLDIPIGIWDATNHRADMIVSKNYVNIIDRLTISKFEENHKKMCKLCERIKKEFF